MKRITEIEILPANSREVLPGYAEDFPHIISRAEIDRYSGSHVPWHWHNAVELFYIESGKLEYSTPNARLVFPSGWGGFVNAGVLHSTRPCNAENETVQLLHLFDPVLVSGAQGSRIDEKYVLPLLTSGCEIIPIPAGHALLDRLKASLALDEHAPGYELRLRSALSEIWLQLSAMAEALPGKNTATPNEKIKHMMVYVHRHYAGRIRVCDLAAAVYSSERECYRLFRDHLHCTPLEYITGYRLQTACDMLKNSSQPITRIAQDCGLGTSSHFGKLFARSFGCTPSQYRRYWQNRDNKRRK